MDRPSPSSIRVLQDPQQLPMLWSHIPNKAKGTYASNIPRNDIGNPIPTLKPACGNPQPALHQPEIYLMLVYAYISIYLSLSLSLCIGISYSRIHAAPLRSLRSSRRLWVCFPSCGRFNVRGIWYYLAGTQVASRRLAFLYGYLQLDLQEGSSCNSALNRRLVI